MSRLGAYDLIETLGSGPHGPSYLGVDPSQGRSHTLKLLLSLRGVDADALSNVLEPLQAVRSPYIARVITGGSVAGVPFVAREYVAGVTLAELRRAGKGLDAAAALGVLDATARALSAFHAAGLAHGNVALGNLLVSRTGELRLADPAIATRPGIDGRGAARGHAAFLAPERLDGPPTFPADLFALGVLGYWLLCDRWPWPAAAEAATPEALSEALTSVSLERPPPLPEDTPSALKAFIGGALNPTPPARPTAPAGALAAAAAALGVDPEEALANAVAGLGVAFFSASRKPPPAQLALPEVEAAPVVRVRAPKVPLPSAAAPTSAPPKPHQTSLEAPMLAVRAMDEVALQSSMPQWVGWVSTVAAIAAVGAGLWWWTRTTTESPGAVADPGAAGSAASPSSALDVAREAAQGASDDEALRTALSAVQELPRSGDAHLLLARAELRKGRIDSAAQSAMTAAELLPDVAEAQRFSMERLLAANRGADALRVANAACERHSSDARLQALRGRALLAEGQLDDAAAAMALSTDLAPGEPETLMLLGETELRRSRWQSARDAFRRAIAAEPKSGRAYAGLASALVGLGRGGEALETLARGLELATDRDAVRFAVGWLHLREGKDAEALTYLRPYTAAHPGDARGALALGIAELRTGRYADAVAALERSVTTAPEQPEAWFNLGMAQIGLGRTDAALTSLHRASEQRFGLWQAHCERGRLLYRLGRHADSLPGLQTALELQPGLAIAEGLLAAPKGSTMGEMIAAAPCGATVLFPE